MGGIGWRGWPRGVALAITAVVAGGLAAVMLGVFKAPAVVVIAVTAITVGLGVLAEVTQWREHRREQAEADARRERELADAEQVWQRRVRVACGPGRHRCCLRRTRSPIWVWPGPCRWVGPGWWRRWGYVTRDVHDRAFEALRGHGLLLLVGDPGDGATRTAYQVGLADPVARTVIAPKAPDGVAEALVELGVFERLAGKGHLLLWLDRIDTFRPGSVTAPLLRECRRLSPGLRVVATISSLAFTSWAAEEPEVRAAFGEEVRMVRSLSGGERKRAQELHPDRDFTYGIGAAFTGMASLQAKLTAGDEDCPFEPPGAACPLSRQVVTAAMDWWGTGTPQPLTHQLLARLAAEQDSSQPPTPEHLDHALAWARQPVREGTALITEETTDDRGDTAIHVNRALAEVLLSGEPPQPAAWVLALEAATGDPQAAGQIGYQALVRMLGELGRRGPRAAQRRATEAVWLQEVTRRAWAHIPDLDDPAAAWLHRAQQAAEQSHQPRAKITALEGLLRLETSKNGPEHPQVAATLVNLGSAWWELGEAGRARDLYQRVLGLELHHRVARPLRRPRGDDLLARRTQEPMRLQPTQDLLVEEVLAQPEWTDRLDQPAKRALNPLFWSNINSSAHSPYQCRPTWTSESSGKLSSPADRLHVVTAIRATGLLDLQRKGSRDLLTEGWVGCGPP